MRSNNLLERTKQRHQQILTGISRLLKQVVNEAAGNKKHRRRTLWGTLRIFRDENEGGRLFQQPIRGRGWRLAEP